MTTVLQMTVLLNMVVVLGPAHQPATNTIASQVLRFGNVTGTILPPSLLEALCSDPRMLKQVRKLKYVHYVGAPLNKDIGDLISRDVKLVSALGSTEAGPYYVKIHSDLDWEYHNFCPSIGLQLEPRTEHLFEAVFSRKPGLERWQQIFRVYPHLDRFPTNDLMVRHPTKSDLWAFAGRSDDVVSLSHGNSLPTAHMEAIITNHSDVRAAIIGGDGRARPFLILDLWPDKLPSFTAQQEKDLLDAVWPVVNEANKRCIDLVSLTKELTILAKPTKPFIWTAKGTVMRRASLELYRDEVNAVYEAFGQT